MRVLASMLLVIAASVSSVGAAKSEAETRERSGERREFRSGGIPRDLEPAAALPENLFASVEDLCRSREAFSFEILDPVDLSGFWGLFPQLPRLFHEEGVDALVIPFTRPRATDLVLFRSLDVMNQIMGRPTTYLMELGKLRSHLSVVEPEKEYIGLVGHDFEESHLRAFAAEFSEVEGGLGIPILEGDRLKLCREREFWKEYLIPRIERSDDLILLGGSFEDAVVEGTVSHELLHAVYYSDERARRLVAEFWDENVTDADKLGITGALEREGYEVSGNAAMLQNEFLAYLLERTASREILKPWVPAYAAKLRQRLADNGIVLP